MVSTGVELSWPVTFSIEGTFTPPMPVGIETLSGIDDGSHFGVEVFEVYVLVCCVLSWTGSALTLEGAGGFNNSLNVHFSVYTPIYSMPDVFGSLIP